LSSSIKGKTGEGHMSNEELNEDEELEDDNKSETEAGVAWSRMGRAGSGSKARSIIIIDGSAEFNFWGC
jgi:hypothetical protein